MCLRGGSSSRQYDPSMAAEWDAPPGDETDEDDCGETSAVSAE
jgi:hypothetical protein